MYRFVPIVCFAPLGSVSSVYSSGVHYIHVMWSLDVDNKKPLKEGFRVLKYVVFPVPVSIYDVRNNVSLE